MKSNPYIAHYIGFDLIKGYVPHKLTFSKFRKTFNIYYLYGVISDTFFKGIKEGIFDTSTLCIYSYPIIDNTIFNNKKRQGKFMHHIKYYKNTLQADFGVKSISNEKPVYDKI